MATSVLHELPLFPGLAIVFLARNCLDVFRSQNRVMPHRGGWTCVAGRTRELRKYRMRPELARHFDERDMLCTIKQHAWLRYQEDALRRREIETLTLDYESLQTHPLWLEPRVRANFTSSKQTAHSMRSRPSPSLLRPCSRRSRAYSS